MKELKYPAAYDDKKQIIKANEAIKGPDYFCLQCGGEMILKKSKLRLKRPHFAHKIETSNCSAESALHFAFKILLYEKIRQSIYQESPLPFSWKCSYCLEHHEGNLLKKVANVQVEFDTGTCIPDIALFTEDNKLFAVIEIIVTHAPDPSAREYYDQNGIIVIEFTLNNYTDIELLDHIPLTPSKVSTCLNGKCTKCGNRLSSKFMNIINAECWNCKSPMKAALLTSIDGSILGGPSKFSIDQILLAKEHGVLLSYRYSKTAKTRYLANICPECNWFIGEFFLSSEYYGHAEERSFDIIKLESGLFCHYCGTLY